MPKSLFFIRKETLAQVFSSEFFKILKNVFFYRTPPVAASGFSSNFRNHYYPEFGFTDDYFFFFFNKTHIKALKLEIVFKIFLKVFEIK